MSRTRIRSRPAESVASADARSLADRRRLMAEIVERGDVALARTRSLREECAKLAGIFEQQRLRSAY